jgi:hypothetical protein
LLVASKAADKSVSCFGSSRQTYVIFYKTGLSAASKAADKKMTKKLGYTYVKRLIFFFRPSTKILDIPTLGLDRDTIQKALETASPGA